MARDETHPATSRSRRPCTPEQVEAFLRVLESTACVRDAAKAAGMNLRAVYRRRERDSEFAERWAEALRMGEQHRLDDIEHHARQIAAEGWARPVYQRGEIVGSYQQPEPRLMMFMMERRRPQQYGDRRQVEIDVRQTARVELTDEDRKLLEPLKRRLLLGQETTAVIEGEVVSEDRSSGRESS